MYRRQLEEQARLEAEARAEEEFRARVVEEARRRLLEEHAAALSDYLPKVRHWGGGVCDHHHPSSMLSRW